MKSNQMEMWAIKSEEGLYAEEISSMKAVWNRDITKARLFTRRSFALSSLNNHSMCSYRTRAEDYPARPQKLLVTLEEVSS